MTSAPAIPLGKPVSVLIGNAFVNTLTLALFAALFAWIVGIGCGILSAVNKNRLADRLFMGVSLLGISLPVFMAAMRTPSRRIVL